MPLIPISIGRARHLKLRDHAETGWTMNVLLVSDNEKSTGSLRLALLLRGHDVSQADTAAAALEQLQHDHHPLIIIDDLAGGEQERLDLLRQIRKLPNGPRTMSWVIVDAQCPADIVAAIDAGASNYLARPLDIQQLRQRFDVAERYAALVLAARGGDVAVPQPPVDDRFRSLVEHAPDVIAILGVDGNMSYINPSIETILGYPPESLVGTNCLALCHPDDVSRMLRQFMSALDHPETTTAVDVKLRHFDDSWRNIDVRFRDLRDIASIAGTIMLARDNTEQKELEEKLERQALYDPLTGLANRALFMDHLEQAIARADRNNQLVAALFMDLDNFKRINDTYGHLAGDHVLAEIANRLRAAIRANDTAARLSGDEFSVLIEDVATEQDVMTVTSRILRALRATVELDGDVIHTTVSIGVAFNTARPVTGVDMLRNADRALYHAKARGKDCVAIYDKSINVVVWNADEETAAGAAPGTGVDGLLAHVGEPDVSEVVPAPPVPMAEAAAAPPAPEPPPMPEHEPAAVDALPPAPAAPPPSTPAAMPDDYADDGLVDRIAALEIQIARLAAGLERPALPRRHGHDDNG